MVADARGKQPPVQVLDLLGVPVDAYTA